MAGEVMQFWTCVYQGFRSYNTDMNDQLKERPSTPLAEANFFTLSEVEV